MTNDNSVDFIITKATLSKDGTMRWEATVSKFAMDNQLDEVTPEFYRDAIAKVESGEYPMPALVVSHYDDPRPEVKYQPVPEVFKAGETTALFIDGNKPKAKGIFLDTPLGRASFQAVKADLDNNIPHEERTRISMAYRPDNGGVYKSTAVLAKYIKGSVRHFALTRVPIIEETGITVDTQLEKSNGLVSRIEDATSIVGKELAAALDNNYTAIIKNKSDSDLREKAEPETVEAQAAPVVEETSSDPSPVSVETANDSTAVVQEQPVVEKVETEVQPVEAVTESAQNEETVATSEPVAEKAAVEDLAVEKAGKKLADNFDMGGCISTKLGEGWERKRAIAACLSMGRRDKGDLFDVELIEKMGVTYNPEECLAHYINQDFSPPVARALCQAQFNKMVEMWAQANGENYIWQTPQAVSKAGTKEDDDMKAYVGMSKTECMQAMVKDGIAEDMATMRCAEMMKRKADLDDVLVAKSINDGEVQVVIEAENAATEASVDKTEGESNAVVASDVNTPSAEKSGVVPEGTRKVEDLTAIFKSVVENPDVGSEARINTYNYVLEQLAKIAQNSLDEKSGAVPSSTAAAEDDLASLVVEAVNKAVQPLVTQNEMLTLALNELAQKSAAQSQLLGKARPKQLKAGALQKSSVTEKKGALTAGEIAEYSVRSGYPY
jgi:hypothetical protein